MKNVLLELRNDVKEKELSINNLILKLNLQSMKDQIQMQLKSVSKTIHDRINGCQGEDDINDHETQLFEETILENFETRKRIENLRDEQFALRNEIYDMVCVLYN